MAKERMGFLYWAPAICVATMVIASVVCGATGDWRKSIFWFLDALITAWSAFMLR